jgi:hypothetical protein
VKLARVGRDNGTYEDAVIKKILSPYADDRSAVTDCLKLVQSGFAGKRAVLIYGFEVPGRPLAWLINAFEAVAAQHVVLGPEQTHPCISWCIRSLPLAESSLGKSSGVQPTCSSERATAVTRRVERLRKVIREARLARQVSTGRSNVSLLCEVWSGVGSNYRPSVFQRGGDTL